MTKPNRARNNPLLWLAAGLVVIIAVPLLLASTLRDPDIDANRRALAQMPEAQRERVEANHDAFVELPPAERERLRRLHESVESNPELEQTLEKYRAWSDSLSPWQRLALRGEPDPAKRLEIVRAAREEQQRKRREDQEHLQVASRFFAKENERFNDGAIRLDPDELREMMKKVGESLPDSPRSEAAKPPRTAQDYLALLKDALSFHLEDSEDRWPDSELMGALIKEIENDEDRAWFEAASARGNGQPNLLESLKYAADHVWWGYVFWRRRPMRDAQTEEFYAGLPDAEKVALQQLSPEERDRVLHRRMVEKYIKDHRDEFEAELAEVDALIKRMKVRGGFEPLPEERRPKPFDPQRPPGPRGPRRGDQRGEPGRERRGGDGPPRPMA